MDGAKQLIEKLRPRRLPLQAQQGLEALAGFCARLAVARRADDALDQPPERL